MLNVAEPEIDDITGPRRAAWSVAAMLMAAQTFGLILVGLWSGVDGGSARSWSFAVTLLALAGCTGALAVLFLRHRAVARTPTLLWSVLLIPMGFTVGDGGSPWVGWVIVGLGVLTFLTALLVPGRAAAEDTP